MTAQDQTKLLGILHLIHGAMYVLPVLILIPMAIMMLLMGVGAGRDAPIIMLPGIIMGIIGAFIALLGLPGIIAGYGLLKRKSWAKTAMTVSAIASAFNFPLGTALTVYSFIFMNSPEGKAWFGGMAYNMRGALGDAPPPPPNWTNRVTSLGHEHDYVPPSEPPNWRDS